MPIDVLGFFLQTEPGGGIAFSPTDWTSTVVGFGGIGVAVWAFRILRQSIEDKSTITKELTIENTRLAARVQQLEKWKQDEEERAMKQRELLAEQLTVGQDVIVRGIAKIEQGIRNVVELAEDLAEGQATILRHTGRDLPDGTNGT